MYHKIRIGKTNTYLLQSEFGFYILIDTTVSSGAKQLIDKLAKAGLQPSQLKLIILTHSHFDHCGCLAKIRDWSQAKVIAHQKAENYLPKGISPQPSAQNWIIKQVISLADKIAPDASNYEPVFPDITFISEYHLQEWGINGYLMHTPGHTEDSISLILDNGIAFVGDTVFNLVPWSIHPPFQDDPHTLMLTWEKLIKTNIHTLLPGHGKPVQISKLIEQKKAPKKLRNLSII